MTTSTHNATGTSAPYSHQLNAEPSRALRLAVLAVRSPAIANATGKHSAALSPSIARRI
ncbi:MAG: hypothetical protein IJG65_02350 [Synergistaceae bacterium]|nr:hypothetical protein [Synergistaceae bacterium]